MKYLTLFILLLISSFSFAQNINNNWKKDLDNALLQINNCENTNQVGVNSCNEFMGGALNTVYKIDDFYSKKLERYLLTNEISYFLKNSAKWKLLGYGYEQQSLQEAQNAANENKAVVALYLNKEGIGHVSIILPGELKNSGTWGFHAPNSTSFFPANPAKSYVDKALSYSFEKSQLKDVFLYVRIY